MNPTAQIAQEISVIMPRIARRVLLGFFQSIEIPPAQLFVIIILHEQGPCRFSTLSKELNIAAPTVTGIVDRLAKGGFVDRRHDIEDRRAINVVLTPQGKSVAQRLRTTIKKRWEEILLNLSSEDQKNYLRILKTIQHYLK